MASTLPHARIVPFRLQHHRKMDIGWLFTYHTWSYHSKYAPEFENFGALRVLNEDRVAPESGFPTHPHRDFEIFSYILSGELTHRDSLVEKGREDKAEANDYSLLRRGDVQFTTGGTGVFHSEVNENPREWVQFLQIWVKPWATGLKPKYHTKTFGDAEKRKDFVTIISPLKAGFGATKNEEMDAAPMLPGTIPIHADILFGAALVLAGEIRTWKIGGKNCVRHRFDRKVYIHVTMMKGGKSKIRLAGRENIVLEEGDGAFITNLNAGDELSIESIGEEEAEVIVLDSNSEV